jgi:hypothetical protein
MGMPGQHLGETPFGRSLCVIISFGRRASQPGFLYTLVRAQITQESLENAYTKVKIYSRTVGRSC